MKKVFVLGLCILSVLVLSGCVSQPHEGGGISEIKRDIVIIGTKAGIFGFHPWMETYESTTMSVNFNVFNSLVEFDDNYRIIPALAYSWGNPDELTWRFNLRNGVKFHNGYDFTAEDVKYTIDSIRADKGSVLKDLLTPVDEVKVVDDHTVDIKTKEPFPALLNKLVDVFIVSKKYQQETEEKWPVGTGCYKLAEYVPGDHITLERFDDYWKGKCKIKTVIFKVIEDDEERVNALLTGKIDIAEFVPAERIEELEGNEGIKLSIAPSTRVMFLSFDFRETGCHGFWEGKNPTSDVRVRKAIYYAINESKIVHEIMKGVAEPASQFLSPNVFGYNPEIRRLSYDPEKAKQLLKEAGYEEGFQIEMDCSTDRYVNDEEICREIKRQLADVNIKVNLNAQPKADFFPKVLSRKTSFYMLGWATDTGDGGAIFDYLLRTVDEEGGEGIYNLGYYSNPEVDRLGIESSRIINQEERLKVMQEGFKIAMEDVAWIPLHIESLIYGVSADLDWEPRGDVKIKVEDIRLA